VKQRIMLGTFALSSGYYDAYYGKAQRARQLIRNELMQAFQSVDLLLLPAWPTPAFKIGEKEGDPLALYLSDICTIPANLAGLPAIAFPCGMSPAGLPIGMQLMGPPHSESTLLKGASAYERQTAWHQQRPKL
jgi:aspartyl-tRNA(Asn)/glutamyl-tRNA(Gln) amidotransferase subunit A